MSNPVAALCSLLTCVCNKRFWALLFLLALFAGACGNDDDAAPSGGIEAIAVSQVEASAIPADVVTPTAEIALPTPSLELRANSAEATAAVTPTPSATATRPAATSGAAVSSGAARRVSELDVAAIDAAAEKWMTAAGAPGLLLAVAKGAEIPQAFSWGVSDLATQDPLTTADYVRIGSVTKPVTTVVVMSLVEEGLIDLDVPVTEYLGDDWYGSYGNGAEITLRHLMGHTAGFVEYAFEPGFFVLASARLDVPITPVEIVRFSTTYGPVSELASEFTYSTTGHVVAGMVVEAVTGNSIAAEIRSRVLDPLEIENTYLPLDEQPPEPVINSYNRGLLYTAFTSLTRVPAEARHTYQDEEYIATNSYPQEFLQTAGWAGGGLESQIADVSKMFRGLFVGGLISGESLVEMTTTGVNPNYGLGVQVLDIEGVVVYGHGGANPGFTTQVLYFPEWDITLAANATVLPEEPEIEQFLEDIVPILVKSWGLGG